MNKEELERICLNCNQFLPSNMEEPTEYGICLNDEDFEPFIEELLEFWLADYLTEETWRTIYQLGNNQLEKLKKFVLEPNIYYCARYEVCAAIVQIAFHEPVRRPEIVEWINDVLGFAVILRMWKTALLPAWKKITINIFYIIFMIDIQIF